MKLNIKKEFKKLPPRQKSLFGMLVVAIFLLLAVVAVNTHKRSRVLNERLDKVSEEKVTIQKQLEEKITEYEELKNQDQVKRNDDLQKEIENIQNTYRRAVVLYEDLLELKDQAEVSEEFDNLYASALVSLSNQEYEEAGQTLDELDNKIDQELTALAPPTPAVQNVPVESAPPGSGYSRQQVPTDAGTFVVSMVAADLGSTRVIVDTASDSDCNDNCPVLSLADYVSRNGAYAGVNGSYFCPASYPSCAGKTNTFDLLVMNKNKTYFNSDNNVYSGNPVVIFGDGYIRFAATGSEWGRDTSPTGVIMNYPLLVHGGNIRFGGDDDPKKGSKGNRSFVANRGNTVYIGVVHSATVAESARVMSALGMENAMNLDNGGSTALWHGGYQVGPGRNLPNVILFVRK